VGTIPHLTTHAELRKKPIVAKNILEANLKIFVYYQHRSGTSYQSEQDYSHAVK
jgi:hypothetical protein